METYTVYLVSKTDSKIGRKALVRANNYTEAKGLAMAHNKGYKLYK
jgi:hypothetical protein